MRLPLVSWSELAPAELNRRRTLLVLALAVGLLSLLCWLLAGFRGVIFGALMGSGLAAAAWWFSDLLVHRLTGAEPTDEGDEPELFRVIDELVERTGAPPPRVLLLDEPAPNAYATGRDPRHASIVVTAGLLDHLDEPEVTVVLAQELAHIMERDTLPGGVVAAVVWALTLPAQGIVRLARLLIDLMRGYGGHSEQEPGAARREVMLWLAPLLVPLLHLALPRSRFHAADAAATSLAEHPLALTNALQKLERALPTRPPLEADPATWHLMLINPDPDWSPGWLFWSRPSTDERVRRLRGLRKKAA